MLRMSFIAVKQGGTTGKLARPWQCLLSWAFFYFQ